MTRRSTHQAFRNTDAYVLCRRKMPNRTFHGRETRRKILPGCFTIPTVCYKQFPQLTQLNKRGTKTNPTGVIQNDFYIEQGDFLVWSIVSRIMGDYWFPGCSCGKFHTSFAVMAFHPVRKQKTVYGLRSAWQKWDTAHSQMPDTDDMTERQDRIGQAKTRILRLLGDDLNLDD